MKWWSETLTASVISTAYECETAHLKRTTTYLLSSRIKWTTAIMQISMVMDSSSELQIVVYLYSSMNWTMSGISVWIFFKFCWCSNSTTLYVCVSLGFFFGKRKSFRIQRMFSFQSFLTRSLFEVIFFLAIFWLLLLFFHTYLKHILNVHSMVNLVTVFAHDIDTLHNLGRNVDMIICWSIYDTRAMNYVGVSGTF